MNERIKELAEHAADHYTESFKFEYLPDIDVKILEKFAELIVKECITITSECSGKAHPDDLIQLFREHFGVQE